ncbi:hypothetical protein P3X46_027526 [Hevea brasiliensis]|uniref:DUF761 domain-containing protein n=1 Tax=Hevea brasiliensis TaxID=3981 RepID=A0ABQ9L1T0_HEVBR|nr:uncharacterized protein LOC110635457 [Hevea brasiliensis]KAJ9154161.1 hypothetical protein P3X46_027526 [Hevea brasiliensis]
MTTNANPSLEILSLSISKKKIKHLMSYSGLEKKLQPAKRAWKRFAKTVESKFHNLNFYGAIKGIKTSSNRLLSYCSIRFFDPLKKRSVTRPPYRGYHYNNSHLYRHYYSNKSQAHKNFSPIYIDQLYSVEAEGSSYSLQAKKHFHAETSSRGKQVVDKQVLPRKVEKEKEKEKVLYSIEDAWREVVAKSPQLRPVDERAEEFISKFHREIKLQKEKSILEFEEMLARGA